MSDTLLDVCAAALTTLPGVGPTLARLLGRAIGGATLRDLLFHLPESYIDRRARPSLREAEAGQVATLALEVIRHEPPGGARQPWRVVVGDGSGFGELIFFRPAPRITHLAPGTRLLVSGRIERFNGQVAITHPDHLQPAERAALLPAVEPVWPTTAGLAGWQIRRAIGQALLRLPEVPEWHDPALMKREGWPGFAAALREVQAPEGLPAPAARQRLAYDELLANQLALALVRARLRARPGRALCGDGRLREAALARFGHPPTVSQIQALAEIDADLAAPRRMLRLLQGDVGAGKTLIALLAMLRAVEAGAQAALMAPTELLARQHHRTLAALAPVPVGLLTGAVKGAARKRLLAGLADGTLGLVIGTHALFQDAVAFADLALAVIDEQHRFGVHQRLLLGAKGSRSDVLVMTATPIPRTLLLTQWGEMAVSRLTGKPAGRQPVRTTLHARATLPEVVAAIGRMLAREARIYWVCPLVAESESLDLAAAEARHAALRAVFGDCVGLAHGRQEAELRAAALADFAAGRTRLLVATTVIEVGLDVAEASVMVIEQAERFGLAQLHQLRGRVGRGAEASFCLLLHDDAPSAAARARLKLLRDTDDGFLIADEDFRLRGGGDLLGTRQSGLPGFRLADPNDHGDLLHMASREAALLLARDPELTGPRGPALRLLLRLFDWREAVRTLLSG